MNIYCVRPRGLNIGNDLIYLGVRHFLEGVNVIRIDGLASASIYEINQYGDGVVVGGGNFYENNEIEVDLNALRALERPLFLFSLSHGRIINREGELVRRTDCMPDEKIIALNKKACISSVRDKATQEYLESIGCGAILTGCPTQYVNRFNLVLPAAKRMSLLFIRNPNLMNVSLQKRDETVEEVKAYMAVARTIVCNDKRDIPFAASFTKNYLYFDDIYQYLATIRAAKDIVSYRLHATIPALAYGVPCIKVTYDERCSSLLETISEDRYDIIKDLFKEFYDYCGNSPKLCQYQ